MVDAKDSFVRVDPAGGKPQVVALGRKRLDEVTLRVNIAQAARDLAASGANFSATASSDAVNPLLWTLGYGGRMQVRKFLADGTIGSPAKAIRDIFSHGEHYGFECATAMMVIFHKAILETVGDAAFDAMFAHPRNLTFFRWEVKDDDYLALEKIDKNGDQLTVGSHYYYKNPDASEENSAFAGENVIYLGVENGRRMFYGHGIVGAKGTYVVSEAELLASLRSLRRYGAATEPFRDDFRYSLDVETLTRRVASAA